MNSVSWSQLLLSSRLCAEEIMTDREPGGEESHETCPCLHQVKTNFICFLTIFSLLDCCFQYYDQLLPEDRVLVLSVFLCEQQER